MNMHHRPAPQGSQLAVGDGLYCGVRAAFVGQGTSLNRWCIEHDLSRPCAVQILRGYWTESRAKVLLARILDGAGISK